MQVCCRTAVLQNISKIPWLGDIPVLGQLFRSERFKRNETELVIIVTPYLVKPLSRAAGALPTDGFARRMTCSASCDASVYRQGLPAPPKGPSPTDRGRSARSGSAWIEGGPAMRLHLISPLVPALALAACAPATEYTESERRRT